MRNERLSFRDSILLLKIWTLAKTSKTLHEEREVTGIGQYSAIKKIALARQAKHCIRDKRLQVQGCILLFKKFTLARQVGHCMRNERLQVQDNIVLEKKSLWQGRQNRTSGTRGYRCKIIFCYFKEYHCGKANGTMHQAREVTGLGQQSSIKKITLTRQAEHSVK